MTKEQFLNGVSFLLPVEHHKTSNSFKYKDEYILQEYRNDKGEVLVSMFEANVSKVGTMGFEAYNYVLGKKIKIKYRFEDLREVE